MNSPKQNAFLFQLVVPPRKTRKLKHLAHFTSRVKNTFFEHNIFWQDCEDVTHSSGFNPWPEFKLFDWCFTGSATGCIAKCAGRPDGCEAACSVHQHQSDVKDYWSPWIHDVSWRGGEILPAPWKNCKFWPNDRMLESQWSSILLATRFHQQQSYVHGCRLDSNAPFK